MYFFIKTVKSLPYRCTHRCLSTNPNNKSLLHHSCTTSWGGTRCRMGDDKFYRLCVFSILQTVRIRNKRRSKFYVALSVIKYANVSLNYLGYPNLLCERY